MRKARRYSLLEYAGKSLEFGGMNLPESKKQRWIAGGRRASEKGGNAGKDVELEEWALHRCVHQFDDTHGKVGANHQNHDGRQ